MILSDYLRSLTEAVEEAPKSVQVSKEAVDSSKEKMDREIADGVQNSNGNWLSKIIAGHTYLFHNGKYIVVEDVWSQMVAYYSDNGKPDCGFSKLNPSDMISYKTFRAFLDLQMSKSIEPELDSLELVKSMFESEKFYV